jgi:hypothetical protein
MILFIKLPEGAKIKMVLLAYSIEEKLLNVFLPAQLLEKDRELPGDAASLVEEVLGRILQSLHLLALNVGEHPQVVAVIALREDDHTSAEGGGDEGRTLTSERLCLQLLESKVLELN